MFGKQFYRFYAISKLLASSDDLFDDSLKFDDKMMRYSVSLAEEIDELLDKGYTKGEIATRIRDNDFTAKDSSLTKEEGEYLRAYCLRLLDVRYKLFMEAKDNDYVIINDDESFESPYVKRLKKINEEI